MIEPELFLKPLMRLFADPAGLDGAGKLLNRRLGRQVREIIFALTGTAMFTNDPDFLAGQMLCAHTVDTLGWPIGDAHAEDVEYLRVTMRGLRVKLEDDPGAPSMFCNEPGIGYRLVA